MCSFLVWFLAGFSVSNTSLGVTKAFPWCFQVVLMYFGFLCFLSIQPMVLCVCGGVVSCTFHVFEHPACLVCIGKHPLHALVFVKDSGVKSGLVLCVVFGS